VKPLVKAQIDRIHEAIDGLEEQTVLDRNRIQEQDQAHEKLQKELWTRQKELSTVQRTVEDFEELHAENERFSTTNEQLKERLNRLLGHVKALTEAMRS
jgi:septation ring formation regulator EzrA